MNWLQILFYFTLGLCSSWGLISLILKWSERSGDATRGTEFHHTRKAPVPRLGGIALTSAFAVCAMAILLFGSISTSNAHTLLVILISSLAMFGLGLWDDLRPLSAKFKLAAQILISAAVYFGSIKIDIFKSPLTDTDISLGMFGFFVTVLWLVSLTNLINLIDGIDGLAGGICLMLMFLLANVGMGGDSGFISLVAIGVSGALLGFLRFNYPPAKIYMGDGGAYFLGFLIGILSIVNSNKGTVAAALLAPAFALALPIVDVGLAVLRRGLRGLPIFRPDRKHIHHHMLTLGISREVTLLNLYAVSMLCLVLAFGVFYMQGRMLPLYAGLLFFILLVASRILGLTKNWANLSSQLSKSLDLRKETQYALTLNRWLVLEIERHQSCDELWQDYAFVVKKLRFTKVRVRLPDGSVNCWTADDSAGNPDDLRRAVHEISNGTTIEFYTKKEMMSEMLFNILGDLASETWYKAATRWHALNRPQLHFVSDDSTAGHFAASNSLPFYVPV